MTKAQKLVIFLTILERVFMGLIRFTVYGVLLVGAVAQTNNSQALRNAIRPETK